MVYLLAVERPKRIPEVDLKGDRETCFENDLRYSEMVYPSHVTESGSVQLAGVSVVATAVSKKLFSE